jgi:hypothetical protein
MPSWKKVVASGSDASFSSVFVDSFVSASSFKGSFTGSLQGTASQAISSSYALTASYALISTEPIIVTSPGGIYYINGVAKPVLTFVPGQNYRFDTTAVDGHHPFKFSLTANGPIQYTYGVTSGSGFIEINVDYATSSSLFYYCTIHSGMGNQANTLRDENLIHNSQTSSMSVLSASYAYTASSATNAAQAISASYSYTASSATNAAQAISASYAYTASSATNSEQAISASYAFTASSAISAYTASSAINANTALTASSADTFLVRNDITASSALITGTLTAQTLVVQTVSSSIVYSSGSNTFGNALIDRQTFTGSVDITGSLTVNGSEAILTNQTASMAVASAISASYAYTASSAVSASLAQTASYVTSAETASYVVNAVSASYAYTASSAISAYTASSAVSASQSISSSYAYTASSAETSFSSISSSFALTASYALNGGAAGFPFTGSAQITGSLGVTGSFSVNGNTGQTVFASNADTLVISGSLIVTGSTSLTGSLSVRGGITGSLFGTASWAQNAVSASQSVSSSYALTASYALFAENGGGGGVSAIYILDEGVVQGTASYFDFTGAGVTATVNAGTASINIPGGGGGSNTNSQNAILNQTSPALTWSFSHNLSTLYPVFTIYDNEDNVIIPQKIHAETTSSAFIYFSSARTGTAVASKGGDITSASFAATASLAYFAISASQAATASSANTFVVRNNLTASNALITGTLTAQTLVVQTVTSSIVYSSGSNRFGSELTDRQTFTGSVDITGSLIVNESSVILTNQTSSMSVLSASFASNGGVTQILAGANVTIAPTNGKGQVTISSTGGAGPFFNTATGSYGSFYDTTTQTNPVANIPRSMSFNTTDITNGVSISGSTSPFNTYIKTENAGVYDIQFSAQIDKTDSGADEIVIWLAKNGTALADTATTLTLTGNNDKQVAAWNWFVNSAANDYYQIIWYSADTDLRILAETAGGGHPGIPSVIATVNRVDQFLSNSGSFSGSFSGALTGSLFGTASWAQNASTASYVVAAQTASYVANAVSSSYAYTASSAISSSLAETASYVITAQTASYVANAVSSSYAFTASSAINASASLTSVSSSYALTASYALNGGGGGVSAIYIQDEGVTQGTASYFNFTGAGVTATVTDSTASINITGGGSGISGLSTTFTQSVAATEWTFVHNLNTRYPLIQVYDTTYNQVTPQYVSSSTADTVIIGFGIATAGYAVASNGGTLYVTGSNVILDQAVAAATWSFNHNLNTQYPIFQVFDSENEVIIPERIVATDATSSLFYFPSPVAGKAVASVGGISGSMGSGVGFPFSGSAVITGSFLVSQSFVDFSNTTGVTGSFSGSLFGTASYATFALSASFAPGFTTNMSQSVAATTWSFTHNLNTINPIVQVYDLTNAQIIPNQIVGMNNSTAEIRFDYAQAGYAVASNGGGLYVTGSTSTLVQTVGAVTWSFTHNLNNKYNTYEVYDDSDVVIIPSGIKAIDTNSAELYFATSQTGRAVAQFSGINGAPNATTASYAVSASFTTNAATASYLNPIANSFVVLTQVSQSLNFVDDAAAQAGGVPLGGLYRNGNFILIRLS